MVETLYGAHRQSRLRACIGLAAAVILPLLPMGKGITQGASLPVLLVHEAVWWSYAAILLLWLHFGERLPLSSIGLRRPNWKTLVCALLAVVVLLSVFVIQSLVIVPMFHLDASRTVVERNLILARPFWYRLLMVLRAAVVEEILFRGYMIEKVRQLTGSTVLAVVVSVATFTYMHLSGWGAVHLIPVFAGGFIFALLYVWRRDLPSNMLAHFIADGVGFLLG
ncbi:MAG TPA: CPBP family intramembrane glutamic endopeptidase [Acidobacteriaceae bacterium]|jgi:membrane protease YdiL (CAAX protease family)|nr:CPBP family intramembrane glutamic endopeptidase [Acidobacteriaceae bacterium]